MISRDVSRGQRNRPLATFRLRSEVASRGISTGLLRPSLCWESLAEALTLHKLTHQPLVVLHLGDDADRTARLAQHVANQIHV